MKLWVTLHPFIPRRFRTGRGLSICTCTTVPTRTANAMAIGTIARELKLSRSTVKRAIVDLEQSGRLRKEQRWRENGGKSSNLYYISSRIQVDRIKNDLPPPRGRSVLSMDHGRVHGEPSRRTSHSKKLYRQRRTVICQFGLKYRVFYFCP